MKQTWLLAAVFCAGLASAAKPAANAPKVEIPDSVRNTLNRTQMGYQELEQVANAAVIEANKLFLDKEYLKAAKKYLEAVKYFRSFSGDKFAEKTNYCRNRVLKCYAAQAEAAINTAEKRASVRDFEEAIKICREALEYCPEFKDRLNARIALYETRLNAAAKRQDLSEELLLPNKKNQEYQIQLLLEQGRKLAATQQYNKAINRFQQVLLIDPFNDAALQNIEALYNRLGKVGAERYKDTHRKMMAEAEWEFALAYLPPVVASNADNMVDQGGISSGEVKVKKVERQLSELENKLNSIKLKQIYFEEVPLSSAIKYLRDQSKLNSVDKIGVNIIVRKPTEAELAAEKAAAGQEGAPQSAENEQKKTKKAKSEEEEEEEEEEDEKASAEPKVSMIRRDVTLMTVLRDLCESLGWRPPKIDRYAVVLAPKNVALEDMEHRIFPVDRDALEQAVAAEGPIDGPEGQKNLRTFFSKLGVKFPLKSTIVYDEKISRLIVSNVSEELDNIEQKIQEIVQIQNPQVQILVKFVEVAQNDLKELAFNYNLAANKERSDTRLRMQDSGNNLLRYYDAEGKGNKLPEADNFGKDAQLTYSYSNSRGTSFMASLFALNWADSSDVLSAPRVTTLPGQTASIKMLEKHYYPDEWETIDAPDTPSMPEGDVFAKVWYASKDPDPQPTFDEVEELGISFEITPRVDGDLIRLDVNFPIKTFDGWDVYDPRDPQPKPAPDPNNPDASNSDDDDAEFFKKPRFNRREIVTSALVADGETIVLGGVTMDTTTRLKDKIPVLGDIPLIGRLFQSRYTKAEKRNLLIFVTCRLVKADGTAFNPSKTRADGTERISQLYQ